MNYFKSFFLLLMMAAILMFFGYLFGGSSGVIIAFLIACLLNFIAWYQSDKIVLAMYHAKEVDAQSAPELHRMVFELTQRANMPMPRIYIIPSPNPNAFATGRDPKHSAIAFTEGIINQMSRSELEGVAAHELSHIKNRDTLIMTIAATIAAAIGMLAYMARFAAIFGDRRGGTQMLEILVWAIIAPLIAMLIQLSISRTREFMADEGSARITGQPLALASALQKLSLIATRYPQHDLANPSTAHMWISSPMAGGWLLYLLSTHPPVEQRIRRLENMEISG